MKPTMHITQVFDEVTALVKEIESNVDNDGVKDELITFINNIIEYVYLNSEDRYLVTNVMQFVVTLFYRVGELDYDNVESVLDVLTMARAATRNILES